MKLSDEDLGKLVDDAIEVIRRRGGQPTNKAVQKEIIRINGSAASFDRIGPFVRARCGSLATDAREKARKRLHATLDNDLDQASDEIRAATDEDERVYQALYEEQRESLAAKDVELFGLRQEVKALVEERAELRSAVSAAEKIGAERDEALRFAREDAARQKALEEEMRDSLQVAHVEIAVRGRELESQESRIGELEASLAQKAALYLSSQEQLEQQKSALAAQNLELAGVHREVRLLIEERAGLKAAVEAAEKACSAQTAVIHELRESLHLARVNIALRDRELELQEAKVRELETSFASKAAEMSAMVQQLAEARLVVDRAEKMLVLLTARAKKRSAVDARLLGMPRPSRRVRKPLRRLPQTHAFASTAQAGLVHQRNA